MTPDSTSRSPLLGLDDSRQITLDGVLLLAVPPAAAKPKPTNQTVGK